MESQMIWTPVHYLIREAMNAHEEALRLKVCGPTLVHLIYMKLQDAGYLKEPKKPAEPKS